MQIKQFIKLKDDLIEIADCLLSLAEAGENSVYRYSQVVYDSIYLDRGRKNVNRYGLTSTYNVEDIDAQVFSSVRGEELFPSNLLQFEKWRERSETPYIFTYKGISLPTHQDVRFDPLPTNFERWDDELLAFTDQFKNVRITRDFGVEQRIIVNSNGGITIESRPFFGLYYRQGYEPYLVTRSIGAYVKSNEDIDRIPRLIRYLPDPTPDCSINRASSFTEAFENLHAISAEVEFETLEDAGLSDTLTHDVIMLSGVPIHEIFGHQFEEPVYPLSVGQQSLFPIGKNVQNPNLALRDNPLQTIEGLDVMGSYQFDSYGRQAREKVLIDRSKVHEHLGSEYVDIKNLKTFIGIDRSEFIGNARQGYEGSFPQSRMSCTILEGREEENVSYTGKVIMIPFHGYVLDGNFFKVMSSECYYIDPDGIPRRLGSLEGSRAIYDAIIGMHILPGKSHHIGSCSKPNVLDDGTDTEVMVSFYTNHQLWEHLTIRSV